MRLGFFEHVPDFAGSIDPEQRAEVTPQERDFWLKQMRQELQRAGGSDTVDATFEVDGKRLRMDAHKHGTAASAVWSIATNEQRQPVAASVFLQGRDGADDAAAVQALREFQPSLPFEQADYNKVLAADRPCVAILYTDACWFMNSEIDAAAGALTLALLAKPGASPKLELERLPTPEEEAAMRQSVERIARVFKLLENAWAETNSFQYTIRASEKVKGRPISEIMHVRFWVGVQDRGEELSIDETVGLFRLVADQVAQLKGAKYLKNVELSSTVKVKHTPQELAEVMGQLQIQEPGPAKFRLGEDRFQFVLEMVRKKANAALGGRPGMHFWVYPPKEFIGRPAVLGEPEVFDKLKDTVWWVKWYDGQYNQLSFGEFLVFVGQIIQTEKAFQEASKEVYTAQHRQSKHGGGWQPKKDRDRKPRPDRTQTITTKGRVVLADIVTDSHIRQLFKAVTLESQPRPPEAMN